jgi:hypothetical protein
MKNTRTYYHLILDRSGSMSSCIEQTIEGINHQIRRIREVAERFPGQELFTSLTIFNHKMTLVWNRLLPEQLRDLTFSDYMPSGTTALLDAVGSVITESQKVIGLELDTGEATAVVVIITDGYENSSKTWSLVQVSSLIRELEQTGKWTFSYLGATLDAVEIAVRLSIKEDNAMYFNISDTFSMYNRLNLSLENYLGKKHAEKNLDDFLNKMDE